jgi:hypothetical protein
MSKFYLIMSLILIFLLFTAEQCSENRDTQVQDTLLEQRIKGIRTNFEADFLSEQTLFEYEKMAGQKLSDLSDFLKILGDTSTERAFREKAAEMISKSFVSPDCRVAFSPDPNFEKTTDKVCSVIQSALNNNSSFRQLSFDSIETTRPFFRVSAVCYETGLTFIQKSGITEPESRNIRKSRNQIEVFINRGVKMLGNDSLSVWMLQFGNME